MFTLFYDKLPKKIKLIFRIIGNLFALAMFFILIPYSYKAISFNGNKKIFNTEYSV